MQFAKGYKTYLVAAVGVAVGAYMGAQPYFHLPAIPSFVLVVLGFTGLYTARSGISTDTQKAVSDVLAQVVMPSAPPVTVNVTNSGAQDPVATGSGNIVGGVVKGDGIFAVPDNLTFNRTLR